jgi:hypothetical protein
MTGVERHLGNRLGRRNGSLVCQRRLVHGAPTVIDHFSSKPLRWQCDICVLMKAYLSFRTQLRGLYASVVEKKLSNF